MRKYCEAEQVTSIYPGPQTIGLMLALLEVHPVSGAGIHDLRLAATMQENGVTQITTYNKKDFAPLPGIAVVDPSDLVRAGETIDEEAEEDAP